MDDQRTCCFSGQSACWASTNSIKRIQISRDDHAGFTLTVIAHTDGHTVVLVVGVKKREANARMKSNRVAIGRPCYALSCAAAMRGNRGKDMLMEEASQPFSTTCGMHAKEVDGGLVEKGL